MSIQGLHDLVFADPGAVHNRTINSLLLRSNHCEDIAIFVIVQDGGCRHLGFSKIHNVND